MNRKIAIICAIFVITVFTGLNIPFCSKDTDATTQTTETTDSVVLNDAELVTIDAASIDPTITANFESADKEAKAWKGDAKLIMVSAKLPTDLSNSNSTLTYTYGSDSEPNWWWTYSYSETTGKAVRAMVMKDDYLGKDIKELPKQYWRTNYIEAFQIAENYSGNEFRKNNPDSQVTITLSVSEPKGWLWWLVEYNSSNGQSSSVRINPSDKTIVDEQGQTIQTSNDYDAVLETTTTSSATSESEYSFE